MARPGSRGKAKQICKAIQIEDAERSWYISLSELIFKKNIIEKVPARQVSECNSVKFGKFISLLAAWFRRLAMEREVGVRFPTVPPVCRASLCVLGQAA